MSSQSMMLVDAYAMIYRGYYAVRSLSTSSGMPSNAVFALSKLLLSLEKDHPASHGAFVFDLGRPQHRLALAPLYKANRPPMPEDLRSQLPPIRELIAAFGWSIVEHDGYEADDLLAAIAAHFQNLTVSIITGDKDISQIVDSRVRMLVPGKDSAGLVQRGVEEVKEKFGVPPESIPDYLALIGDSSDNIEGVAGVGPKTAASLISQFTSVESLLARTDEIAKESLKAKIVAASETIRRNMRLVTLDSSPPPGVSWTLESFARRPHDIPKLKEIAASFEIKSLAKEMEKELEPDIASPTPQQKDPEPFTLDLFS